MSRGAARVDEPVGDDDHRHPRCGASTAQVLIETRARPAASHPASSASRSALVSDSGTSTRTARGSVVLG
jgi:hypothetical protein